mmetsp:Transcript_16448/g.24871  ORF Transcript_16448/g.24871 Transcript_16448/m.24871 type:complete len:128 (+) Transcript_16448:22-405(+)|eukprot:scaffold2034_cov113-Skeletonema_dohrnii-CCMP3373.AAC.3
MNDDSLQSVAAKSIVVAAALLIIWMGKTCAFHSRSTDLIASSSKSKSKSAPRTNATTTEALFDNLADVYDSSFCHTTVGRLLRHQTWKDLDEAFATSKFKSKQAAPILEIGCGTGDDALHLASQHVL